MGYKAQHVQILKYLALVSPYLSSLSAASLGKTGEASEVPLLKHNAILPGILSVTDHIHYDTCLHRERLVPITSAIQPHGLDADHMGWHVGQPKRWRLPPSNQDRAPRPKDVFVALALAYLG
ncbi:hypothetical protein SODALDRAFT_360630 [Sodiomyces alkalinus F11]|uniref:Uncharacterized protein n=1 Tax=Sodiomyces alkalinus (strain CBS 110278 / VKM F-3762 / F11) TaxID=1314773 RepID=A0A3N2PUX3_SODAK|nr:hypothetical protein SODALDRAFT_360630 [Sodiomyces alkalinus F11]ROT38274.1 hypothetical protein SODALDRAFT_360630 [Sodiomyces alkalinus F11]